MNNIPSGLPPYMFIDDDGSFNQELFDILGNTTTQKKYNNLDQKPLDFACFSPRISPQDFLSIANVQLNDFTDKNIVDIGGGAGCLALLIQNEAKPKTVEIVDPVFQNYTFDFVVSDSIKKLTGLMKPNENIRPEYKDGYIKSIQKRKESREVLEKYQQGLYRGVKINASYGNETGIASNSQDIVFINHILHKLDDDKILEIIKESYRILKKNGELIIIEYEEADKQILRVLNIQKNKINQESSINQNKDSFCIRVKKQND